MACWRRGKLRNVDKQKDEDTSVSPYPLSFEQAIEKLSRKGSPAAEAGTKLGASRLLLGITQLTHPPPKREDQDAMSTLYYSRQGEPDT